MTREELDERTEAEVKRLGGEVARAGIFLKLVGLGVVAFALYLDVAVDFAWLMLALQGLFLLCFIPVIRMMWGGPKGRDVRSLFLKARASADLETAIPHEDGTATFISETRVYVGPGHDCFPFEGDRRLESASYDEPTHRLHLHVVEENRRGRPMAFGPRRLDFFVPLPLDWSARKGLWLVERWARWMTDGPEVARASFPAPEERTSAPAREHGG